MTLATDIAGDFVAVVDGLETATLKAPVGFPISSTTLTANTLRRAISTREAAASDGRYTTKDVAWHFPVSAGTPQIGGSLTDSAGDVWTILEADKQTLGKRWRCICRKLTIDGGAESLVTIQAANWVKGPHGSLESAWQDVYAGVKARIEPQLVSVTGANGQVTTETQYRIYLSVEHEVTHSSRIVGADGTVYRVQSVEPATIDGKQVVIAVSNNWGEA